MIVIAIAGVLAIGVWALWWDQVRAALGLSPPQVPAAKYGPGTAEQI